MHRIICLLLSCIILGFGEPARAGGFQVTQQSARSLGLGDGGFASLGEPVLLHNNPALLGFLPGTVFSFGSTVVMPDTRFTPVGSTGVKMLSQVIFPPNVSLTHNFGSFAVGVSGSIPFAMNSEWGETWVGALESVRSDFRVVYLSPGFSFALSPKVSVGAALNIGFPRLQMSHRFNVVTAPGTVGLESFDGTGATGLGATVGILLRPSQHFTLGLSYMSKMKLDIDQGSVSYSELPDSLAPSYPQTTATFSLSTPDLLRCGMAFRLLPWLSLEANAQYAFWSSLQELTIRYPQEALQKDPGLWTSIPLGWKNTWTFHAGLEFSFDDVVIRTGYIYDETPVPDDTFLPSLPDADRRGLSIGLGYFVSEGLRLDFGYQYLQFLDRSISPNADGNSASVPAGKYTSTWTVVGINVSYFWN